MIKNNLVISNFITPINCLFGKPGLALHLFIWVPSFRPGPISSGFRQHVALGILMAFEKDGFPLPVSSRIEIGFWKRLAKKDPLPCTVSFQKPWKKNTGILSYMIPKVISQSKNKLRNRGGDLSICSSHIMLGSAENLFQMSHPFSFSLADHHAQEWPGQHSSTHWSSAGAQQARGPLSQ